MIFKIATKNYFFNKVFGLLLLKVHLHHCSQIKSLKEVTKEKEGRFPEPELYLVPVLRNPNPGRPKTSGSGSQTLVGIRIFLLSFSQNSYFGFLKLVSEKNSQNCENVDYEYDNEFTRNERMLPKYHFRENRITFHFHPNTDSRCTA